MTLGQCSSRNSALHMIHGWAGKKEKSFDIIKIERYNYSVTTHKKNYFRVTVNYRTDKKGKYMLGGWDYNRYILKGERFQQNA